MKKLIQKTVLSLMILVSCYINTLGEEVYYWISQQSNLFHFVEHDHVSLKLAEKELGIKTIITGPENNDLPAFIAVINEVVALKPAGIMLVGWDPILVPAVDAAIEKGVNVITVDADLPGSKRLAFVGSNWYKLGRTQAKYMAKAINYKGKVGLMGILNANNMQNGFRGFIDYMKENAPDVGILGPFDDKAIVMEAARIASNLITKHPDLAGLAGFDVSSGPGISITLKEANKVGKIKVTCTDAEIQQLQLVKEGVVTVAIGQKREFFTYYGLKLLYDLNHSVIKFTANDKAAGITNIPSIIETGFNVVHSGNVDFFLDNIKSR